MGFTGAVVKPKAAGRIPGASGDVTVEKVLISSLVGPRSGLFRLFYALVALATLLFAVDARASVPMCSEDGRTIAAPPIGTAARGLVLEASAPCPKSSPLATRSLPGRPSAPVATNTPAPPRAVPVCFGGVAHAASERLALTTETSTPPGGVHRTIDRPPRA